MGVILEAVRRTEGICKPTNTLDKKPEVRQVQDMLESKCSSLEEMVSRLTEKLSPVLSIDAPTDTLGSGSTPYATPLAGQLAGVYERLLRLEQLVSRVIDRVEV